VLLKAPAAPARLARQVVELVQRLRQMDLYKVPGVAETIDWAEALAALDARELDLAVVNDTLGVLLKYQDDIEMVCQGPAQRLLDQIRSRRSEEARPAAATERAPAGQPGLPHYDPETGEHNAPICG